MLKITAIIGARPQFIKAASVSRAMGRIGSSRPVCEILVHTGQHYDDNMSEVFFRELAIPCPHYNLGVGSGTHGRQTAQMLMGIEDVLLQEKPDWVLVYGDTNSTLAGALATAKLNIPLAHVEAGLRSYNRRMPEEINRMVADHLSSLLFCPSQVAVENLTKEGITRGVHLVGDVMADSLAFAASRAMATSDILKQLSLKEKEFLLATVHRAENTDEPRNLVSILRALEQIEEKVVFPVHPRTRKILQDIRYSSVRHVLLIEPVGYFDMIRMAQSARMILTDSGGIQKEAYWLGVPCVTLRNETEWVETVENGWTRLAGTETQRIVEAVQSFVLPSRRPGLYGDGKAAEKIVQILTA